MTDLQIFNNPEFGEIRTIVEGDAILFCGSDVAQALGYAKPQNAVATHCKGALKRGTLTPRGHQEMSFIPESDLYRLVFRSKLPTAEKFTDWVTTEVLPTIRKTGGYLAGSKEMSDAEIMAKALLVAQKTIESKNAKIEEMRPKALFADSVAASDSCILIGELAKILRQNGVDMGEKRLFEWMRSNGFLVRRKGTDYNMPTQRSMELGLFKIKETVVNHSSGYTTVNKTPKVTGKGQQYFINKFLGVTG